MNADSTSNDNVDSSEPVTELIFPRLVHDGSLYDLRTARESDDCSVSVGSIDRFDVDLVVPPDRIVIEAPTKESKLTLELRLNRQQPQINFQLYSYLDFQ